MIDKPWPWTMGCETSEKEVGEDYPNNYNNNYNSYRNLLDYLIFF
jgi:hypothetical protein